MLDDKKPIDDGTMIMLEVIKLIPPEKIVDDLLKKVLKHPPLDGHSKVDLDTIAHGQDSHTFKQVLLDLTSTKYDAAVDVALHDKEVTADVSIKLLKYLKYCNDLLDKYYPTAKKWVK